MVEEFLSKVDQMKSIEDLQFKFREFERLCIKGLYQRMYKKFPYDANYRTSLTIDVSKAKIRYIVNN